MVRRKKTPAIRAGDSLDLLPWSFSARPSIEAQSISRFQSIGHRLGPSPILVNQAECSRSSTGNQSLSQGEDPFCDETSNCDVEIEEVSSLGPELGNEKSIDCDAFLELLKGTSAPDNLILLEDIVIKMKAIRYDDEPDGDRDFIYKNHMEGSGVMCIAGIGRFQIYGDFFEELEGLKHTIFAVKISNRASLFEGHVSYNVPQDVALTLSVHIKKPDMPEWGKPSESIKQIFNLMFPRPHSVKSDGCSRSLKPDLEALYKAVKVKQVLCGAEDLPTPNRYLKPSLRLYQLQALKWMLSKETSLPEFREGLDSEPEEMNEFGDFKNYRSCRCKQHLTYLEVVTHCGAVLYYNSYDGSLTTEKPMSLKLPTGGILADEMGLGKTVEVLALILANPRPLETDSMELDHNYSQVTSAFIVPDVVVDIDEDEFSEIYKEINGEESTVSQVIEEVVKGHFSKSTVLTVRGKLIQDEPKCTISAVIEEVVRGGGSRRRRKLEKSGRKKKLSMPSLLKQASLRFYNAQLQLVNKKQNLVNSLYGGPEVVCLCGKPAKGKMLQCCTCKTLQHIHCVGIKEDKLQRAYYCPQCWQNKELLISGSTLIVSPASICDQWVGEVKKHIDCPSFKIHIYTGVHKKGFEQPTDLAKYDIVITTYETLRNELKFAFLNQSLAHKFRNKKRFVAPPSPLVCIQWWRVCLDEAQMAQGTTTQIGMMARKLPAVHRWAITGTPLYRSIEELFGIIDFLGVEFFNEPRVWRYFISDPYREGNHQPLHQLMAKIMWRTAKNDVLDQIHIPGQVEETHWVHFSPIEEHFYRTEHESNTSTFRILTHSVRERLLSMSISREGVNSMPLSSLDRSTLSLLMGPLLHLRQACTVMVGRRKYTGQPMLTMEEVLEQMIKKTATEGDEALREHIASINGLAALHIIKDEWAEAVELYRSVLRLMEEYKEQLTVDKLQTIHTLHNLADVLEGKHPGVPPTLRDDVLRKEATQLETKYMERYKQQLVAANQQLEELTESIAAGPKTWWADVLVWVSAEGHEEEMMRRLEETFKHPNERQKVLMHSYTALRKALVKWSDELTQVRDRARQALTQLYSEIHSPLMVHQAANCHLTKRPQFLTSRSGNTPVHRVIVSRCSICEVEEKLKKYENILFAIQNTERNHSMVGDVVVFGQLTQGSWQASDQEMCLKVLHTLGRSKKANEQWLAEGSAHFKFLDAVKKEFRRLRVVWTQLRDLVSARDELRMCHMRLRLVQPDEPPANVEENRHILDPFAVPWHQQTFEKDRVLSKSVITKKTGTLHYLKNLRNNSDRQEPCPVCQAELSEQWCVLQCGHVFCLECLKNLGRQMVVCALCREKTHFVNVSYVHASIKYMETDLRVNGSFSSKVIAIISCLLKLRAKDPEVKVLVFSTWEVVLDILGQALNQNNISFLRLPGKDFQQNVRHFKTDSNITALLLPLRSGSKGLNLTEASHVILTEPILNPSDELQALGRVHRFGQTKQTVVHRFLVRGSIEERIYRAVSSNVSHWEEDKVTVQQLVDLFPDNSFD